MLTAARTVRSGCRLELSRAAAELRVSHRQGAPLLDRCSTEFDWISTKLGRQRFRATDAITGKGNYGVHTGGGMRARERVLLRTTSRTIV